MAEVQGCQASAGGLRNACSYSFRDLFKAAHPRQSADEEEAAIKELYAMTQDDRNVEVKKWADAAGWSTEDQMGNGTVYTAFSPEIA